MDSRRTPRWILGDHLEDQFSSLFGGSLPPEHATRSGDGAPVQGKPSPVPSHDCFRVHNDESLFPTRPQSPRKNPEKFVKRPKPWSRMLTLQDCQLLPKNEVFEQEAAMRAEEAEN
jgi:hypothetical protein